MSMHSTSPTGGGHPDADGTDIVNGNNTSDLKRRYYRYLVEFLSFRDSVDYSLETEFSIEHLRSIQAHEVVRWLKKKVYDNPDPSPYDIPIGKPASLEHYKKALSYFMPDRDTVWHDATRSGNPTKSKEVQGLIKQVKSQSKQQDMQQHQDRLSQAQNQLNRIIHPSTGPMTSAPLNNATPNHTSHASTKNSSARKDRRKPPPKKSDLDYTLELLEDQTDDPSVVHLLNNADVHDGNHHHGGGGGGGGSGGNGGGEGIGQDQFRVLYREMLSLRKEVQSLKDEFKTDLLRLGSKFALDNLSARQSNPQQLPPPYQPQHVPPSFSQPPSYIPYQPPAPVITAPPPVRNRKKKGKKGKNAAYIIPPAVEWQMQFTPDNSAMVDRRPATLCENPKTLYVMWQEYMFGINGSKPAKDFTSNERGLNKSQYSRRKVAWEQIVSLMRSKYLYTANQAIEKIYSVYGIHTPLTKITEMIRIDQKERGGHPELKDII